MMSIRKKLILSNLAMLFVPVILVMIISNLVLHSFVQNFAADYGLTNENTPEMVITLSKLVGDNGQTEEFLNYCHKLENSGIYLKITDGEDLIYNSEEFDSKFRIIQPPTITRFGAEQLAYNGPDGSAVYFAQPGAGTIAFQLISEKVLFRDMIIISTTNVVNDYIKSVMWINIAVIVVVIILTNGFLTFIMSRSILVPLAALREGTHQIREGNLDHAVNYQKKDEFGEVCADFEDMRLRLKQSVEKQAKDQQNRKELITGITHDLRTPLTRIKGYTAGILDGIADTPEKRKSYLQTIRSTVDNMQKMVDDLFLFSKLDLNHVPFYFTRVDMNRYLEKYCEDRRQEFNEQEVDIVFEGEDAPQYALIDQTQLQRVINNILNNSARYKGEGRSRIEVSLRDRGDDIHISFRDDGQGVSPEEVGKIFEIFYRTDKARSETEKGSGVGLAIAKQIIEIHKGTIWARSEPGKGLEIHISLPKDEGEAGK